VNGLPLGRRIVEWQDAPSNDEESSKTSNDLQTPSNFKDAVAVIENDLDFLDIGRISDSWNNKA
jgi:hypothetical protein